MYDPASKAFDVKLLTYKQSFFERLFTRRAWKLAARNDVRF